MSGPRLAMTLLDCSLMPRSSSSVSFPAPGNGLSITYFGIVFPFHPAPVTYSEYPTWSTRPTFCRYGTMRTESMRSQPLSSKPTPKRADKRVDKGVATRAALLVAGREMFGEHGFAATSLDDVVARAGVTKGALYHHFTNKEDLFRAVFEEVSAEVSDLAVELFLLPDSWEALVVGCNRWIDANLD